MIRRIKQFYRGWTARLRAEDHQLVNRILAPQQQKLFYEMAIFDQYHTLKVYKTVEELINTRYGAEKLNKDLLYKAALLHDIGRRGEEITLMGKVYPVLMPFLLKSSFPQWSRKNYSSPHYLIRKLARFGNYFYVHKHHPSLGAQLIEKAAYRDSFHQELVYLIANHHHYNGDGPLELLILQYADSLN